MEAVEKTPLRASLCRKDHVVFAADIEYHYRVELELAGRLRNAPRAERLGLYGPLYDELFRRVPNHPQLTRKVSEAERRAASNDKFSLLATVHRPEHRVPRNRRGRLRASRWRSPIAARASVMRSTCPARS